MGTWFCYFDCDDDAISRVREGFADNTIFIREESSVCFGNLPLKYKSGKDMYLLFPTGPGVDPHYIEQLISQTTEMFNNIRYQLLDKIYARYVGGYWGTTLKVMANLSKTSKAYNLVKISLAPDYSENSRYFLHLLFGTLIRMASMYEYKLTATYNALPSGTPVDVLDLIIRVNDSFGHYRNESSFSTKFVKEDLLFFDNIEAVNSLFSPHLLVDDNHPIYGKVTLQARMNAKVSSIIRVSQKFLGKPVFSE